MRRKSNLVLRLAVVSALLAIALNAQEPSEPEALDANTTFTLDQIAARVAADRAVFIGESHTRYDHHLNQLELLKRIHRADPQIVLGVEYFQQPFQGAVDDYIAGKTDENEFLRATEYFERWGYDYRLYAPIFRYAREQHIPVRALNVPAALSSAVVKVGIAGLTNDQRVYLPKQMEPAGDAYKERLRKAFEAHGPQKPGDFDRFVEAQLVWDEGMAEAASAYLDSHPQSRMVILAGSGHIEFGSGIPSRLKRRTNASIAIVINSDDGIAAPHVADYVLFSEKLDLPPAGVLGVRLENRNGECRIVSVNNGGPAAKAGIKKDEIVTEIDGQPIHKIADTRLILWDKKPGDRIRVAVRQPNGASTKTLAIELGAAAERPGLAP